MRPRRQVPGTTYFITRRTFEGYFRLAPSPETNNILLFNLLRAAEKTGVQIHGFCFMSNHFHLVVTDVEGRLDAFTHCLCLFSAKCLNALLGHRGIIWEPGDLDCRELHTPEDVMEKLIYTICNPTRAHLVRKPVHWPGVKSLPVHFDGEFHFKAKRPRYYFNQKLKTVPKTIAGQLHLPPGFESLDSFRQKLMRKVRERCRDIYAKLRRNGGRFLGKAKIHFDPTKQPEEPILARKPRGYIICSDKVLRSKLVAEYRLFWKLHEEARQKVLAGEQAVEFPYGTNWWHRQCGMPRVETPPG